MRTVSSLVYTIIAKTPVALVAIVALPITRIGKSLASITEDAFF
jgi:hypothetical protein